MRISPLPERVVISVVPKARVHALLSYYLDSQSLLRPDSLHPLWPVSLLGPIFPLTKRTVKVCSSRSGFPPGRSSFDKVVQFFIGGEGSFSPVAFDSPRRR